ncbi:MAG: prolipoprotein diacylglyceryl transferase [Myxococcaceae bacterium]|nr:prolipoprotein diacylglyceryl transferase [Myxococcaceae bacterium]
MIPYFQSPVLELPLGQKIDLFGVLSAAGVMLGAWLGARAAKHYAPGDDEPLRGVVPWTVSFGLVGGHFLHLFAYHPELIRPDPWGILRVWDGLSSMGGVLGALLGIFVYFRREKIVLTPYLDAFALGTAPGWMVARIGCFVVHDHPGVLTDSPLAVNFPPRTFGLGDFGGPRYDLGLFDVFVLGAISVVLYLAARKRPKQGRLMALLALLYAPCRFFLDFLRASDLGFVDRRYLGLTPAQYIVVGLFITGIWLWRRAEEPSLTPSNSSSKARAPQTGA